MIALPADSSKELVWAGSRHTENRNIYDFRMVDMIDDKPYLAMLVRGENQTPESNNTALIYDNRYEPVHIISSSAPELDLHEINVQEPPKALSLVYTEEVRDLSAFGEPERNATVWSGGFIEFDITTGEFSRQWRADKISLDESFTFNPKDEKTNTDWLHVNSIDKNKNGDFLMSARRTDTIYFISGDDGRIIWRLGGKRNDFQKDFEFSRQHDARFISVNDTHMVLSLLNNGAGDWVTNEPKSSAMYVELDTTAMTARLLNRYNRPDGGSTNKRGNMQTLPNGNVLASWSMNGYMSEFAHDGKLLMDASFASDRFSTYRAYKFPWWSQPSDPPTLVASCYGVNGSELSTVFYSSWNGATEVRHWRFYAQSPISSEKKEIGVIPKTGFETSFISRGYMDMVSVHALDADYQVLGESSTIWTTPPEYWTGEQKPTPDDPDIFLAQNILKQPSRPVGSSLGLFTAGLLIGALLIGLFRSCSSGFLQFALQTYHRVLLEDPEDEDVLSEMGNLKQETP